AAARHDGRGGSTVAVTFRVEEDRPFSRAEHDVGYLVKVKISLPQYYLCAQRTNRLANTYISQCDHSGHRRSATHNLRIRDAARGKYPMVVIGYFGGIDPAACLLR